MADDTNDTRMKKWQIDCEYRLESYRQGLETMRSEWRGMFESVILSGANAVRALLLVNGGASVAMLAFLGHLFSSRNGVEVNVDSIRLCLLLFGIGTALATFCAGWTYFTQSIYAEHLRKCNAAISKHLANNSTEELNLSESRAGNAMNWIAIVAGFGSYVAFCLGIWEAYQAFPAV